MGLNNNERIELHCHTCGSRMNGTAGSTDIFRYARQEGIKAIAFTDYDTISTYPEIQTLAEVKYEDVKPIYGIELLVAEDIISPVEGMSKVECNGMPSYYVLVLVRNEQGLKNLYQIINESIDINRPCISWSRLLELKEGLLIGSGCSVGEVFHSIMKGLPDVIVTEIASRYDFIEVQPVTNNLWLIDSDKASNIKDINDIKDINLKIIDLGKRLNIPIVATSDAHYVTKDNHLSRAVLMNAKGWLDEAKGDLHIRTTKEMLEEFSYLPIEKAQEIVIDNTNMIANMIESIEPIPNQYYCVKIAKADETLRNICEKELNSKYMMNGIVPEYVKNRLNNELHNIEVNGFAEIYLHYADIIKKNNLKPSQYSLKGLGASSIVAYLLGISKVNPLSKRCPLYVEFFAGLDGNKEPRFDLIVDENAYEQVRGTLNNLDGVGVYVWATKNIRPTETRINAWIEEFEDNNDCVLINGERQQVIDDLRNVVVANGRRLPGTFFIVPKGKENLLPRVKDLTGKERVFPFSWYDVDNIFNTYFIFDSKVKSFVSRLEDEIGVSLNSEMLDDEELIKEYKSLNDSAIINEEIEVWEDVLNCYNPESFIDIVRVISLVHGTGVWEGNGRKLLIDGNISRNEIITTREDVYEMLLKCEISKEKAYAITEYVRKGRFERNFQEFENIMREHDVPEWFVESCKKVRYLFSRAHAAEYAYMILEIAYFHKHHKDLYEKIYKETFSK